MYFTIKRFQVHHAQATAHIQSAQHSTQTLKMIRTKKTEKNHRYEMRIFFSCCFRNLKNCFRSIFIVVVVVHVFLFASATISDDKPYAHGSYAPLSSSSLHCVVYGCNFLKDDDKLIIINKLFQFATRKTLKTISLNCIISTSERREAHKKNWVKQQRSRKKRISLNKVMDWMNGSECVIQVGSWEIGTMIMFILRYRNSNIFKRIFTLVGNKIFSLFNRV